jgi:sugar/nucleoside kinase (ribokinase family)
MPAVGNSANAAVACARLGLKSALRAYVGRDANGKACLRVV